MTTLFELITDMHTNWCCKLVKWRQQFFINCHFRQIEPDNICHHDSQNVLQELHAVPADKEDMSRPDRETRYTTFTLR